MAATAIARSHGPLSHGKIENERIMFLILRLEHDPAPEGAAPARAADFPQTACSIKRGSAYY